MLLFLCASKKSNQKETAGEKRARDSSPIPIKTLLRADILKIKNDSIEPFFMSCAFERSENCHVTTNANMLQV